MARLAHRGSSLFLLAFLAGSPGSPGVDTTPGPNERQPLTAGSQSFTDLKASAVIEQAIGIADVAFGKDPNGVSETLHFTGPVKVQKWPMPGYSKKVLPDGRVEISAEIVDREKGMLLARCATSFQVKAPVTITVAPGYPWQPGEPGAEPGKDEEKQPKPKQPAPKPAEDEKGVVAYRAPQPGDPVAGMTVSKFKHRSIGTITQLKPGVDFPAMAAIDLYLNLHTPVGVLHNEQPLELRSVIDGIPPVKAEAADGKQNEWHAGNMPIRFVNDEGETMAWMTTRAHSACLVHPNVITQAEVEADVTVQVAGKDEKIRLKGMTEIHRYDSKEGTKLEMVQLFLDGNSNALGGAVMLSAPNNGCRRVPIGKVSEKGTSFDLPLILKTTNGELHTGNIVRVASAAATEFPHFGEVLHGGSNHPLVDADGKTIGNLDTVDLKVIRLYQHPPVPGVLFVVPR